MNLILTCRGLGEADAVEGPPSDTIRGHRSMRTEEGGPVRLGVLGAQRHALHERVCALLAT